MEEQRLRVCENRVRRRVFGPKGEVVKRGCSKLHNEELILYFPSNIRVIISRR